METRERNGQPGEQAGPARILVVDDEREICDLVGVYLENEGFAVERIYDGTAAAARIEDPSAPPVDLAVLDIMLPGVDGLELCRRIREHASYPIIMLTAKGEATDKIAGLSFGADDYVTKPFLPLELVARVKAQIRRSTRYNRAADSRLAASAAHVASEPDLTSGSDGMSAAAIGSGSAAGRGTGSSRAGGEVLTHAGLVLDVPAHEAWLNERELSLTPTEFSILRILLEADGAVISARDLYCGIFGDAYYEKGSGSITVHIRHLREKLGDSFEHPVYIKTVWGCGYKIER